MLVVTRRDMLTFCYSHHNPGDVANTEAIKAGHTGWYQAGIAAENIVRMVKEGDDAELEVYKPTKPMIKVSVGKVSGRPGTNASMWSGLV